MPAPVVTRSGISAVVPSGSGGGDLSGGVGAPRMNPLARIYAALKRYKWIIVLMTTVGSGLGFLATRLLKPMYEVRGTLFFEAVSDNPNAGPVNNGGLLSAGQWVELLTTFSILDPGVRERRLFLQPRHRGDDGLFARFDLADRFVPGVYKIAFGGN